MSRFFWVLPVLLALDGPAAAAEDARDKAAVNEVLQTVLETEKSGVQVPWSSAATGNAGTIEVERTFFPTPDRPCRDYVRTIITPDGKKTSVHGTGCRIGPQDWTLDEKPPETEAPKKTATKPSKTEEPAAPAKKPGDAAGGTPEKEAKAATPKPAARTAEKPAPPVIEYSLPTSSAI